MNRFMTAAAVAATLMSGVTAAHAEAHMPTQGLDMQITTYLPGLDVSILDDEQTQALAMIAESADAQEDKAAKMKAYLLEEGVEYSEVKDTEFAPEKPQDEK